MTYQIQIEKSALKQLSKLEKRVREKITAKIDDLASDPRPFGYKKLAGNEGFYRIKVGDYRIIYEIEDEVLIVSVLRVTNRRDAY